jgi:hypothetical protein
MPSDIERITVCRKSGRRAAAACRITYTEDGKPNTYNDYFLRGTGPYEVCGGDHIDPPPVEPGSVL